MSDNNTQSGNIFGFAIVAAIVLVGIAVGVFFMLNRSDSVQKDSAASSEMDTTGPSSTSKAVEDGLAAAVVEGDRATDGYLAKTDDMGSDGGLGTGVYVWDAVQGSPDAPITIIEYASWTCSFCRDFHLKSYKQHVAPAIEAGQVRYIVRELLRNGVDLRISLASRCEGIDFKSASDALFGNFDAYTNGLSSLEQLNRTLIALLADQGMTEQKYAQCMKTKERAQFVKHISDEGSAMGVRSTPTVFINGKRIDNSTFATLDEQIADLL